MAASIFYHQNRKQKRFFWRRRLLFFLKTALIIVAFFVLGAAAVFAYYAKDLPDPAKISERQITESTKIFDRTGTVLLYDIHGEEKRTVVPFAQISDYVKKATIAVEDANFYNHIGLDLRGILRAALYNLINRDISQGGSTITQQFIKKSILSDERTWSRKIKEAVLALELERKYSKNEILGFYLNQIPYGSNAYGIEAAAQTFFSKPAKNLDLAESALLAALPQSPSRLSPFGSHPEELRARQEYVLNRMVSLNFISSAEAEAAKNEKLKFSAESKGIKAPHFVMYVKEYLEEKYGQDYIEKAGLKVYTTLDWDLQQLAEQLASSTAQENWKKYRAYNVSLVATDPKTGQILTMVGSRDYFDLENDGNVNVAIRERQPGSSFKPFAYVTAFEKGYTPDTVLFDLKTEFNPLCPADCSQEKDQYGLDCYHPGNYDEKVRGPVTMRQALAQSLNIPSVQTLYLAGIEDTLKTAKDMGITTLNEPYYGLALVLGGGAVKLLDEVAGYGVFAQEGMKSEKTAILKIEDSKGSVVEEFRNNPKRVLEPQMARLISDILSDNNARTPVFGANSVLYFPDRPVAAKTGTTQGYRDAWTIGYTPSLAVGVWVGNNDNSAMAKAGAGIAAAGPFWHAFIKKAYELKTQNCQSPSFCLSAKPEQFTKPEPIIANKAVLNGSYISSRVVKINSLTGQLATADTPPELVMEKTFPEVHNVLYYVQKNTPQGDPPANPIDDPQFQNWETAVISWLALQGSSYNQPLPPSTDSDSLHNKENLPTIKILSPPSNTIVTNSIMNVQVSVSAPLRLKQIDFFVNDDYVSSLLGPPYQINITLPPALPIGQFSLKARIYDSVYNHAEDKIQATLFR